MKKYFWEINDSEVWHTATTLDQIVTDAYERDCDPGTYIRVQPETQTAAKELVGAEDILEQLYVRAHDICETEWPDETGEAKRDLEKRLRALMDAWAKQWDIGPLVHGDIDRQVEFELPPVKNGEPIWGAEKPVLP